MQILLLQSASISLLQKCRSLEGWQGSAARRVPESGAPRVFALGSRTPPDDWIHHSTEASRDQVRNGSADVSRHSAHSARHTHTRRSAMEGLLTKTDRDPWTAGFNMEAAPRSLKRSVVPWVCTETFTSDAQFFRLWASTTPSRLGRVTRCSSRPLHKSAEILSQMTTRASVRSMEKQWLNVLTITNYV